MSAPTADMDSPTAVSSLAAVRGLCFTYRGADRAVLEGIDLDLFPGQVLGVLGPNGAGKSTLLRAITSTVAGCREGIINIAGDRPPAAMIGFANQDVALYPTLSVRENMLQQARLLVAPSTVAERVDQAIEDFRLTALVDRRTHELSGGQRRMVHLAVSFVHRPMIRLLDEPTTALDFETRNHLIQLVAQWRRDGCAVLVTAHIPEDIEELCTDLVLLRQGAMTRLGALTDFLTRHEQEVLVRISSADGEVHEHKIEIPSGTVADLQQALLRLPSDGVLSAIEFSSTRLRSILTRDPALSSYVNNEGASP